MFRIPITSVILYVGLIAAASAQDAQPPVLGVLGNVQDGGFPHIGCHRPCCSAAWGDLAQRQLVTCLGLVDPVTHQRWLFEASPDLPQQLSRLNTLAGVDEDDPNGQTSPTGIIITHAHLGHYTGLMYLGREAMGADGIPVYAMPRMRRFLRNDGPWSQLVSLNNIELRSLTADTEFALNMRLKVTPFLVPHRDEFSETVGFMIRGPQRSAVFLPDIDKWERWNREIETVIEKADLAFLDGTFFSGDELPGCDLAKIPHPLIEESLLRFQKMNERNRRKIYFIHMNHTNPALRGDSAESKRIIAAGFNVARTGDQFEL